MSYEDEQRTMMEDHTAKAVEAHKRGDEVGHTYHAAQARAISRKLEEFLDQGISPKSN